MLFFNNTGHSGTDLKGLRFYSQYLTIVESTTNLVLIQIQKHQMVNYNMSIVLQPTEEPICSYRDPVFLTKLRRKIQVPRL